MLAFLSAFAVVATNSAAVAADSATIAGTLTRTSGAGSPSTTVAVTRPDGTMVASTSTAGDGTYSVGSLPAGDYRLKFTGTGLITQWYGGGEDIASGTIVTVGDGESATAPAVIRQGGVITGSMLNADGTTFSATVTAQGPYQGAPAATTRGSYTLRLNTEEPVKVRADLNDTRKFDIWAGEAFSEETSPAVQVDAEQTLSGIDLRYPEVGRLLGKVTNSFDAPLDGSAQAYALDRGQVVPLSNSESRAGKTQDYSLTVPANVPVTVKSEPMRNNFGEAYEGAFLGGGALPEDATFLTVAKDEARYGVDVALQGGKAISGYVTDQSDVAIEGVTVTAFQGSRVVSRGTTSASGYYILPGIGYISLGDVQVRFTGETIVEQWYAGAATQSEATTVTTFGSFGSNKNVALEYLPEYRLVNVAPPTIAGSVTPSGWVEAVPGEWNKKPTSREFSWYCDGVYTYNGGTTWSVGDRGCREISVREVARLPGHQSGVAFSAPVAVTAKSELQVSARERVGKVILKSRVTTPGVRNPGGTLRILRGTKQLAKYRITSTPATMSYAYRGRRGPQTFVVKYSGSDTATAASKKVRAVVR
ncbi:carboxypeptidase-like regulatory domain-containing protein [Nocardioides aquaticus]|nr:carboxypeptidase-like regulatory domain-containing protein [Nocardioides aquaticus]